MAYETYFRDYVYMYMTKHVKKLLNFFYEKYCDFSSSHHRVNWHHRSLYSFT